MFGGQGSAPLSMLRTSAMRRVQEDLQSPGGAGMDCCLKLQFTRKLGRCEHVAHRHGCSQRVGGGRGRAPR